MDLEQGLVPSRSLRVSLQVGHELDPRHAVPLGAGDPGGLLQRALKAEAFHGFSQWLMFGGEMIGRNDPDYQEKIIKFNELMANCVIYSTALDITAAANALATEGHPLDHDDLATITPYITHRIRRFGDWVLDLSPPETVPVTTLDLVPGALFPGDISPSAVPAGTAPRQTHARTTSRKVPDDR